MQVNHKLHPLSHSIISLSTAYHEYNPLFIQTFHSLVLLNGVDCIITTRQRGEVAVAASRQDSRRGSRQDASTITSSSTSSTSSTVHVLPISKCRIVGVVVYCQYKSNNSVAIVIDDGTGHCDCIGWIDASNDDIQQQQQETLLNRYQVGNIVQVQGAIKVLSLDKKKVVRMDDDANVLYEGWLCFRELQIHSIQTVTSVNDEILHWLRCLDFRKRIGLFYGHDGTSSSQRIDSGDDMNEHEHEQGQGQGQSQSQQDMMHIPILNGLETLQSLPRDEQLWIHSTLIGGSYSEEESSRSVLFKDQYERLFAKYYGRNCKCQLMYKDILLYCHCLATKERLDPDFKFRDTLLSKLVDMEKCIVDNNNNESSNKNDVVDVDKRSMNDNDDKSIKRLEFQYSTVCRDEQLNALAKDVVSTTTDPGINLKRLYTNTFRHLRNDGVVYLLDVETDSYLLLSKDNVLLPEIIQYEIENDQWNYQHQIMASTIAGAGASSKVISPPPQLPKFLQSSLSSAKLRLLQSLAKRERSNNT